MSGISTRSDLSVPAPKAVVLDVEGKQPFRTGTMELASYVLKAMKGHKHESKYPPAIIPVNGACMLQCKACDHQLRQCSLLSGPELAATREAVIQELKPASQC